MPAPPRRSWYVTDSDIAVRDFLARRPREKNYMKRSEFEAAKETWRRLGESLIEKYKIGLHDIPTGQKIESSED